MVVKQLQPAEDLLPATAQEGKDVRRAEKTVHPDTANRLMVTLR